MKLKRKFLKLAIKALGMDKQITVQHLYWPERRDSMMLSDLVCENYFPIKINQKEPSHAQKGHYIAPT